MRSSGVGSRPRSRRACSAALSRTSRSCCCVALRPLALDRVADRAFEQLAGDRVLDQVVLRARGEGVDAVAFLPPGQHDDGGVGRGLDHLVHAGVAVGVGQAEVEQDAAGTRGEGAQAPRPGCASRWMASSGTPASARRPARAPRRRGRPRRAGWSVPRSTVALPRVRARSPCALPAADAWAQRRGESTVLKRTARIPRAERRRQPQSVGSRRAPSHARVEPGRRRSAEIVPRTSTWSAVRASNR